MHQLLPLAAYFRPYRRYLVSGIACTVVMGVIGLLSPLVVGRAIDLLRGEVTRGTLLAYGGIIVGIYFVQGIFHFAHRMILVALSRHIEYDLGNDFFRHLERLHSGFFQRHSTGDLIARATNDLEAVRMVCGPAIMYAVNTVVTTVGAFAFLLYIHPGMTLLSLAPLPVVAAVARIFGRKIHVLFGTVQATFSDLSTRVQENLSGARVVRAYAQEEREMALYGELNGRYVDVCRHLIVWNSAFQPLLQTFVGLGFVIVLAYGGSLMVAGELTMGQYVTFNLFLNKLVWPMVAIGWVVNLTERAAASFSRMQQVFETEPLIRDGHLGISPGDVRGSVRFAGLGFRHDEESAPVLRGLDLTVEAGQTVAVVGRTGSGKSTLLSLLPRFLEAPPGQLFLDGADARDLPLATLRGAIAMVPQESFLFSTTIRENILFGRRTATDEEVREAARLAGLDHDLEDLPDGLETVVGERGVTLSGGQKQRVALARALLRDASILLLDDCLSAVDAETEERILGNLRTVFPGRTVFQVSHRLSAVRGADLIVVLDRGEISERGTHEELLAQDGLYADLHRRQRLEEQLAIAE